MKSALAFQAVIRPATPTGSMVTVVLPHFVSAAVPECLLGGQESADARLDEESGELDDASVFLDHHGRQFILRAEAASCRRRRISARSSLVDRPKWRKRRWPRRWRAACLPHLQALRGRSPDVGRLDDVHHFAAVRFHERSVDVVGGDCFDLSRCIAF